MAEEVVEPQAVQDPSTDTGTPQGEVVQETPVAEENTPAGENTEVDPVAETPEGESTDEKVTYEYEGLEMEVEVPPDLAADFKAKGLDVGPIVKELYDGEFGLSDKTIEKLSAIYPKSLILSYLEGIKARNELVSSTYKTQLAQQEAGAKQVWEETVAQIGGDESTWGVLEDWALNNLNDSDLADFNSVMEKGTRYSQRLAVDDLLQKYKKAEGDDSVSLVDADSAGTGVGADRPLSAAEYIALFPSKEYYKNPQKYDRLRELGRKQGL